MEDIFSKRRNVLTPHDPTMRGIMDDIDRQTRRLLEQKFGIIIDHEWHCYTITNVLIETIVKALSVDMMASNAPRASINFYDIFIARVSNKTNRNAEKEGNINISFEPGPKAEALIDAKIDELLTETFDEPVKPIEYFTIEDPDMDERTLRSMNMAYLNIDRKLRTTLSQNFGIVIVEENAMYSFAIAELFIMSIFRYLLYKLGANPETEQVTINFNDNIEFHSIRKDGGVILTMNPGYNAKLLIKSDETTEPMEEEVDVPWLN